MVLGIGEGSIEIVLGNVVFHPGETISGTVKLTLKNPKKAKELRIIFYGEKKVETYSRGKRGTKTVRVYEVPALLDKEKEYPAGITEYPFELSVPHMDKVIEKGESSGILGTVFGALEHATDPVYSLPWYIDASLNIPMSFDISKKIRIRLERYPEPSK